QGRTLSGPVAISGCSRARLPLSFWRRLLGAGGGQGAVGARLEVRRPGRVNGAHRDDDPDRLAGGIRGSPQGEVGLGQEPVFLLRIARPARGDDVLPHVFTTSGPWDHVVDVFGARTA